MTLRDIFLLAVSALAAALLPLRATFNMALPERPPSTSPLWPSLVFAAGFTPTQKGLT